MPHSNEFVEFLMEGLHASSLDCFGLRTRAMFGGFGIYMDELMFALVADDALYFKTADNNRADFEQRQLHAFSYSRNDKTFTMSYHEAPPEVLDDPDEMARWAKGAIDAAMLSRNNKNRKKPKS